MQILIVKLSSLGDLFHALPAVHNLKVGLDATVDWVVQSEYADLVRCFSDVDRVIALDRFALVDNWVPFRDALREREYDLIVDLQGLLKSALTARFARGCKRIGPSFHREGSRLLYHAVAGRCNKARHAVDECLDVVRYLGLTMLPVRFPMAFPPYEVDGARPRVALVPCSRWESKNWPPACFVDVARRLQAARGAAVFVVGGAADRAVCAEVAAALEGHAEDLAGTTTLAETGGLLGAMDLVITNDSGPMHMAAAVGTPTLAVFGPTDPARTGPYGNAHRVVAAGLPCRPCFSRACRQPGIPCLAGVTPVRVTEVALEMLAVSSGQ